MFGIGNVKFPFEIISILHPHSCDGDIANRSMMALGEGYLGKRHCRIVQAREKPIGVVENLRIFENLFLRIC